MMDDLRELYQQVILDHNRDPKNYGRISCTHSAEGYNPLCGDKVTVYLRIEKDSIIDVHFEAAGCAISKASASLMTVALKGKSLPEAREIFQAFIDMITTDRHRDIDSEKMGSLVVLAGVREFPSRVKCAGLAWHAFRAALDKDAGTVSTE
jgi:nitrogen fixation NifU-like protein